jgi:hypothetical protein
LKRVGCGAVATKAEGQDDFEARYRKRIVWNLNRRAEKAGLWLGASEVPI